MIRGKTLRRVAATLAALFILSLATPAAADSSLIWALLLPGVGQAQDGHYAKASIFGTAALISWTGFFATQINYSNTVTRYENQKRIYNSYLDQLADGGTVYVGDLNDTYSAMNDAYSQAEDEEQWRNIFVGALVVTYAVNVIDILMSDKESGEVKPEPVSLEWRGDSLRLVRTIRF